ncbi:MAG TPA: hypothetical protein VFX16_19655 [Pseudonocardiaceae bacterium]|nr:hypothetical protein [Pseudonocardiaceae bacterium]
MVVDVARFTDPRRTIFHQEAVREGLYAVLRNAFTEAGIDWVKCTTEDRGDGALILVPPDVPKIRLADQLSDRLLAGLRRYNKVHAAEAAIQLRVALHSGEVWSDANGWVGPEINFAFRILDAEPAKAGLDRSGGMLALIASDNFYRDVVAPDPGADPGGFEQIQVLVKRTSGVAWLRLLGVQTRVLGLLVEQESALLRDWLADVAVPQLPTLIHRAAGPSVQPMPGGGDAWQTFQYLSDFNAGPDGFPPALAFLELLARQVGGPLADKLSEWTEGQARRLRLEPALAAWRAANPEPVADPKLHLTIAIEPDAMDDDRFLVSHWRQDDPDEWPGLRGDIHAVHAGKLEHQVDDLVVAAERAWSGHDAVVYIDFVLPRALMGVPVHRWAKERESGHPVPLCLAYPVVVRSLERMRSPHWRRVWRQRWRTLLTDPAARVLYAQPVDPPNQHEIHALLEQDLHAAALVLSTAPPKVAGQGDELTAALRSGLPAVFWHAALANSEDLRQVVTHLVEGDGWGELPARAQAARQAAFLSSSQVNPIIARDLVVLWDDPFHVVAIDGQQPQIAAGQGGASIEGERAS